jgi:tRNA modification GTPase
MYHNRLDNTIVALATSPGSSIGIIRISGPKAFDIASFLTGKSDFTHMNAFLSNILSTDSNILDKGIVLPFFQPQSFTGEDVVELHVHGSQSNARDIVNLAVSYGAKPALKGEFTFRAVLNGKMDLQKAFSLNTLITSLNPVGTELSRKASFENQALSKLEPYIKIWEKFYALSTAVVDFPDQIEDNLPVSDIRNECKKLTDYLNHIVSDTLRYREFLDFKILILGKPNVGKSSLFNILLHQDRAIISDEEGTTRDYLTETVYIKRFPVKLIDTAGLRESDSEIEKTGISKARNLIAISDLLLILFDSSKQLDDEDIQLLNETLMKPRIIIQNKCDISSLSHPLLKNAVKISCLSNEGIDDLFSSIEKFILQKKPDINETIFFNDWQLETATLTINSLKILSDILKTDQIELINYQIKTIFNNIRNLSGEISSINIYDKIFGSFCLGK